MRFANANDDFEIAKTIDINAMIKILIDFKNEIDMIYYNHRLFACLMLLMRITFKK